MVNGLAISDGDIVIIMAVIPAAIIGLMLIILGLYYIMSGKSKKLTNKVHRISQSAKCDISLLLPQSVCV